MDDQEQQRPKRYRRPSLTKEDVAQIKAHLQEGKNPAIIARYFEVNSRIIYAIRDEQTYRHIAPAAKARPLSELSTIMRRLI
jgi:hypothetical protein